MTESKPGLKPGSLAQEAAGGDENSDIEVDFQAGFDTDEITLQKAYANAQGLWDHYNHKNVWSFFLMGLLGVVVLFQMVLLTLVGIGYMDFTLYKWLLPTLLVQNLAQIIGLVVFVVKSLFK